MTGGAASFFRKITAPRMPPRVENTMPANRAKKKPRTMPRAVPAPEVALKHFCLLALNLNEFVYLD